MQAWLLPAFTGISSLSLSTAPDPIPAPNQIILQLRFASLNPADAYLALGQYPGKPAFPHILGRDGVGTVLSIGIDVSHIHPGDIRLILRSDVGVTKPGTLAKQVAVDAAYSVPLPQGWSEEQSAAAPLVYLTAWQALTQWGELPSNALILVTGASGGVGTATIQLAAALGYRIVALSRSEEKSQRLRLLGATWTLDPANPNWRDALKAALGNDRVDLAVDNIGGDTFPRIVDVMAMHGRISVVGRLAGPVPNFNTASLFFRRLKIGGVAVGTYTIEESLAAWNNVLQTLAKSGAKPLIDHVFPFTEVPAAFARLAQGPMGKVLVQIQ